MIEFGKTLREAREAKGLTIEDIVKKTHMMSRQIAALENEDFSLFAAPIYGRGFVKLYCEAVGLDANVMVAEFMDIFNGNREPTIRTREDAPLTPPTPSEPQPPRESLIPEPNNEEILTPETTPYEPPRARYAAPTQLEERGAIPGSSYLWLWRPLVLLISAVLILWLMFIGVRALYRAMQSKPETPIVEEQSAPTTKDAPKKAPATRQKIVVEPLYID